MSETTKTKFNWEAVALVVFVNLGWLVPGVICLKVLGVI